MRNLLTNAEERDMRRLIKCKLSEKFDDRMYDDMLDYIDVSIRRASLQLNRLAMITADVDTAVIDEAIERYNADIVALSNDENRKARCTINKAIYGEVKNIWAEQFDLFNEV